MHMDTGHGRNTKNPTTAQHHKLLNWMNDIPIEVAAFVTRHCKPCCATSSSGRIRWWPAVLTMVSGYSCQQALNLLFSYVSSCIWKHINFRNSYFQSVFQASASKVGGPWWFLAESAGRLLGGKPLVLGLFFRHHSLMESLWTIGIPVKLWTHLWIFSVMG